MKRLGIFFITAALSLAACFTAFAGEWKKSEGGWWYANGDSTYANDGWRWIDGRCYYFTPQGYCLQSTTTPDGYQVDGSGAWMINGVVQTQGVPESSDTGGAAAAQQDNAYRLGNLRFTPPAGYGLLDQTSETIGFINSSSDIVVGISVQNLGDGTSALSEYLGGYLSEIMDAAIIESFGQFDTISQRNFPSGAWTRYDYASVQGEPDFGSLILYARLNRDELQIVIVMGNTQGIDADGMMNNNVK